LQVAHSLPEHVKQLADALAVGDHAERARAFVTAFVRPHGIDTPATPILANAIERLAHTPCPADPTPRWARAARVPLFGLALAARAAWGRLKKVAVTPRPPLPRTGEGEPRRSFPSPAHGGGVRGGGFPRADPP
jgi:hypothetical protein